MPQFMGNKMRDRPEWELNLVCPSILQMQLDINLYVPFKESILAYPRIYLLQLRHRNLPKSVTCLMMLWTPCEYHFAAGEICEEGCNLGIIVNKTSVKVSS